MTLLEKIMERIKMSMPNGVGIQKNNVKSERLQSGVLENSLVQNEVANSRKRKLEESIGSIRFNVCIERNYKLTQKSNFVLWMDLLKSELTCYDLLDVIDAQISGPENLSESLALKRKFLVRDIIINRLDEYHHRRIFNEPDPKEIIKKLSEDRQKELNAISPFVRARPYQIKMKENEEIYDFCERFDSVIADYEALEDTASMTEEEKRFLFYEAVSATVPEVSTVNVMSKCLSKRELTIDEIKRYVLQLEAIRRKTYDENDNEAQKVNTDDKPASKSRCSRCNRLSHLAKNCWFKKSGEWFCYNCQAMKTHKSQNCPQARD